MANGVEEAASARAPAMQAETEIPTLRPSRETHTNGVNLRWWGICAGLRCRSPRPATPWPKGKPMAMVKAYWAECPIERSQMFPACTAPCGVPVLDLEERVADVGGKVRAVQQPRRACPPSSAAAERSAAAGGSRSAAARPPASPARDEQDGHEEQRRVTRPHNG
jgi:hypothetical protein